MRINEELMEIWPNEVYDMLYEIHEYRFPGLRENR